MNLFSDVKACIFDIDFTLIGHNFEEEVECLMNCVGISKDYLDICKKQFQNFFIDVQESEELFTVDLLKRMASKDIPMLAQQNVDYDFFIESLNQNHGSYAYEESAIVLDYLKQKGYELYCLTDWFKASQSKMLEDHGLLHFFTEIIACDNCKQKPDNLEGLKDLIGDKSPASFLIIGDSLLKDVGTAIKFNIPSILVNSKSAVADFKPTIRINNLLEIRDLL